MSKNKYQHLNSSNSPKPPHIFFTVFTGRERHGWVLPALNLELIRTAFRSSAGEYRMSYFPVNNVHPISAARNVCVDDMFLAKTDADWLAMFDNDIGPPEKVVDAILAAPPEADIIILPYWVWTNLKTLLCFGKWENGQMITQNIETKGWVEGGSGGTGAMFIRRRVFTEGKLKPPFFKILYDDYEGQTTSEDIWFTSRAREAGYRIFTHTDFICSHYRSIDLAEVNIGIVTTVRHYADLLKKQYGDQGIVVPDLNGMFTQEIKRGIWITEDGVTRCPDCKAVWPEKEDAACRCDSNG